MGVGTLGVVTLGVGTMGVVTMGVVTMGVGTKGVVTMAQSLNLAQSLNCKPERLNTADDGDGVMR